MLQNSRINLFYRIICLIAFIIVVIKACSFITLSLLTIAFYLFTRNESDGFNSFLHIMTIIIFVVCFFIGNYLLLKIILILDLVYYYLYIPSRLFIYNNESTNKMIVVDKYFIRFKKNSKNRKGVVNNNWLCTIYVTVHLFILFIAIMVG